MTRLDKERKLVAERAKKFEKTASGIQVMAEKLHKKMEKLPRETNATPERARVAGEHEQGKSTEAQKLVRPLRRDRTIS